MALSLDGLRNLIQTSIFGRRVGLDANEFMIGPKGLRGAGTFATSDTTGTAIPNYGFHSVETTTDDTWLLQAPVPGCMVTLYTVSTSTGVRTIQPQSATIVTTIGTAGSTIILTERGAMIQLFGNSTSQWVVTARGSTAAGYASS